jgi:hypothetical protein
MAADMHAIAQLELFFVNPKPETLEALQADIALMQATGKPLKRAFRFFDERNRIAPLAQRFQAFKAKESHLLTKKDLKHFDAVASQRREVRRQLDRVLKAEFVWSIRNAKDIAIEIPDRFFEYVTAERRDKLLTYLNGATGWWLFMFAPNDLLADRNKSLASVM